MSTPPISVSGHRVLIKCHGCCHLVVSDTQTDGRTGRRYQVHYLAPCFTKLRIDKQTPLCISPDILVARQIFERWSDNRNIQENVQGGLFFASFCIIPMT